MYITLGGEWGLCNNILSALLVPGNPLLVVLRAVGWGLNWLLCICVEFWVTIFSALAMGVLGQYIKL